MGHITLQQCQLASMAFSGEVTAQELKDALSSHRDGSAQNYKLLKISEAAEMLSCSVRHCWNLIQKGDLHKAQTRGLARISEQELIEYINGGRK